MAIYDNIRLIVKICEMFYEGGLSQKEISTELGISKPQICRMLSYAKEQGIIKFVINNPYSQEFELEKRLIKKYHLKEAYIFNFEYDSEADLNEKFGSHCAGQLDKYFNSGSKIGVMSGKTIASISRHAHRLNKENIEFVPLVGGLGTTGAEWHANAVARNFASRTGGSYCILNAPVLLKTKSAKNIICSEPSIKEVLDKGKACTAFIVGIGDISPNSTACLSGAYNPDDTKLLLTEGAAASVCTTYISRDGKIISSSFDERSIGVSLSEMKGNVIAAAVGEDKLNAADAALKSDKINIFMTTLDFAEKLLNL